MAFVLVNNLEADVVYTTTAGPSVRVRSGGKLDTRIDVGATVTTTAAPRFTARVSMPGYTGSAHPTTTPVTSLLLPVPGTGIQYDVLETVSPGTVTLHRSPWSRVLLTNTTASPAVFRFGFGSAGSTPADPIVVPGSGSLVVSVALGAMPTAVDVITSTGGYSYGINGAIGDAHTLAFTENGEGVYVSGRTAGVWAQLGVLRGNRGGPYIGAWTALEGPPPSLLQTAPLRDASDTDSCKTTHVTK